jgi:hypothetical protein
MGALLLTAGAGISTQSPRCLGASSTVSCCRSARGLPCRSMTVGAGRLRSKSPPLSRARPLPSTRVRSTVRSARTSTASQASANSLACRGIARAAASGWARGRACTGAADSRAGRSIYGARQADHRITCADGVLADRSRPLERAGRSSSRCRGNVLRHGGSAMDERASSRRGGAALMKSLHALRMTAHRTIRCLRPETGLQVAPHQR